MRIAQGCTWFLPWLSGISVKEGRASPQRGGGAAMPIVKSGAIARLESDAPAQTLSVWLRRSAERQDYYDVPELVYRRFLSSETKGRFFEANIRGQYWSNC